MHKETELNIGAMAKEYCKAVVVLLVKFCNLRAYGKFVVLSLVFFFLPVFSWPPVFLLLCWSQFYIQLVFKAPLSITLTISDQKIVSGSLSFQHFEREKINYKSFFM